MSVKLHSIVYFIADRKLSVAKTRFSWPRITAILSRPQSSVRIVIVTSAQRLVASAPQERLPVKDAFEIVYINTVGKKEAFIGAGPNI